jgi:hypothetical protein
MRDVTITWDANRKLVAELSAHGARYLVVGGAAVLFHAPERRTFDDLDLLVEPTLEVAKKVRSAMNRVAGHPMAWIPEELAGPSKQCRDRSVFYCDILTPRAGVDFSPHWDTSEEARMVASDVLVRVASIPTLLALLRSIEEITPKHVRDIELLEEAQRRAP